MFYTLTSKAAQDVTVTLSLDPVNGQDAVVFRGFYTDAGKVKGLPSKTGKVDIPQGLFKAGESITFQVVLTDLPTPRPKATLTFSAVDDIILTDDDGKDVEQEIKKTFRTKLMEAVVSLEIV